MKYLDCIRKDGCLLSDSEFPRRQYVPGTPVFDESEIGEDGDRHGNEWDTDGD